MDVEIECHVKWGAHGSITVKTWLWGAVALNRNFFTLINHFLLISYNHIGTHTALKKLDLENIRPV